MSEEKIPENGDCGYLALGITRSDATELLLANANSAEIRDLVADEIYDMFATLPDEMMNNPNYKQICTEQERLDTELQQLLSYMNDLIRQPENDRWSADVIFEYFSTKDLESQLNMNQRKALQQLIALRERNKSLDASKKGYCNEEASFREYVEFYMQPQTLEYFIKYGESNWLNSSSVDKRTSSADAIVHLMGKNLVIMDERGIIEHQHFTPNIPVEDTLILLHIGNWHFNRLISY